MEIRNNLGKKQNKAGIAGIGYAFFLLLLLVILLYCSYSSSLWVDEVFSLKLVNNSWKELLEKATQDVHPPLYYLMLKAFLSVSRLFGLNDVFAGKLFSAVPLFLTILIPGRKMAERQGRSSYIFFAVCLTVMPNMLNYAIEIRGYSWAMFFVTAAYAYAGEIMRTGSRRSWYLLVAFGILAAYTHYFACIAVAIVYLGLLGFHGTDRKFLKNWFISVLVSCILFFPWLLVFFRQLGMVMGDYWIGPITWKSLYDYFRFLFEPPMDMLHVDIILGVALAAVYGILFIFTLWEKRKRKKRSWLLWGSMVLILTVAAGIVVSFALRPIFIARYMVVALGCFWIAFAGMAAEHRSGKGKLVCMAAIILVFAVGFVDTAQFIRWEIIRKAYYEEFAGLLREISEDALVVTDGEHMQGCLSYYLEDEGVAWISAEELPDVADAADAEKEIWYFCSQENAEYAQISGEREAELLGEYHLEYYSFTVFRIT